MDNMYYYLKTKKCATLKTINVLVCFLITLSVFLPIVMQAQSKGKCGPSLTWELTKDGVLTISGSGVMDYDDYSSLFLKRDKIKTIIRNDGMTTI